eukprot:TRINITY_DN108905_c0_g1_i1.p1 TRINITY_DN108905_c0_g1~~TRINITY_DN108905_c0_g1_i1.p1  ORF type:complete len:448 (-),score=73.02 TRINITY_DN108905_c0_g1_i1:10-1353(-)
MGRKKAAESSAKDTCKTTATDHRAGAQTLRNGGVLAVCLGLLIGSVQWLRPKEHQSSRERSGTAANMGSCDASGNCGSIPSQPSETANEARGDSLCCFNTNDVALEQFGDRPEHAALVVDNFLCPSALRAVQSAALRARKAGRFKDEGFAGFPGHQSTLQTISAFASPDDKAVLSRITKMEHILCLRRAVDMLRSDVKAPGASSWTAKEQRGIALGQELERAIKGSATDGSTAFERAAMQAENEGFMEPELCETATMFNLISSNYTLKRLRKQGIDQMRFSFTSRPPGTAPIHIDKDSAFVFNLHLSSGFEDTGTAFWRKQQLGTEHTDSGFLNLCQGRVGVLMDCKLTLRAEKLEFDRLVATGMHPGPGHNGEMKFGNLEVTKVLPWRENRVNFYSGHFLHSAHFPSEAARRAYNSEKDGSDWRLMLQMFLESPAHEISLKLYNVR